MICQYCVHVSNCLVTVLLQTTNIALYFCLACLALCLENLRTIFVDEKGAKIETIFSTNIGLSLHLFARTSAKSLRLSHMCNQCIKLNLNPFKLKLRNIYSFLHKKHGYIELPFNFVVVVLLKVVFTAKLNYVLSNLAD